MGYHSKEFICCGIIPALAIGRSLGTGHGYTKYHVRLITQAIVQLQANPASISYNPPLRVSLQTAIRDNIFLTIMEPVSAVASIIGIIQLASKVTTLGYGYIGSVKRASEDVEKLMAEILSLSNVLVALKEFMDHQISSGSESKALQTLDGALRGCTLELERLELNLKSLTGMRKRLRRMVGSLQWPFKESETLQIMTHIERHKNIFILALSTDHM